METHFENDVQHRCTSLVDAILDKYGYSDSSDVPRSYSVQDNSEKLAVFLKVKSTAIVRKRDLIVLNEHKIETTGDLERLSDLLESVLHLDLSKNQFDSWKDLCEILCRCPLLEHCDLSFNPSHCVSVCSNSFSLELGRLKRLVLNGTQIPIKCLADILRASPRLEELHLSLNDYANVKDQVCSLSPMAFHTIHLLHLNQCSINAWTSIAALCSLFPCLEILVAAENPVQDIGGADKRSVERIANDIFGCLHCLNINRWPISDWNSIDCLRFFPLLSEIRARYLPLYDGLSDDERRMLFIARLPNLVALNGSAVSKTQREDAERFFIRYHLDASVRPERYYELVGVHGHLNKLLELDLSPKNVVEIRLFFDDEKRSENRKISLTQSVAQFKKSLGSFCSLPPSRIRLWYLDSELGRLAGLEELRYPGVMLHALRVADGDEFHIQAKPENSSAKKRISTTSSDSNSASPVKN